MWKKLTGYYPDIQGNAKDMDNWAKTKGYRVVANATARSMVVFEPGVQGAHATYGHVAWVNKVIPKGSGKYDIEVTEMNAAAHGGGFDVYNTYTYHDVAGMSYIVATP